MNRKKTFFPSNDVRTFILFNIVCVCVCADFFFAFVASLVDDWQNQWMKRNWKNCLEGDFVADFNHDYMTEYKCRHITLVLLLGLLRYIYFLFSLVRFRSSFTSSWESSSKKKNYRFTFVAFFSSCYLSHCLYPYSSIKLNLFLSFCRIFIIVTNLFMPILFLFMFLSMMLFECCNFFFLILLFFFFIWSFHSLFLHHFIISFRITF